MIKIIRFMHILPVALTPRLGAITRGLKFGAKRPSPRVIVPGSLRPATAACYILSCSRTETSIFPNLFRPVPFLPMPQ